MRLLIVNMFIATATVVSIVMRLRRKGDVQGSAALVIDGIKNSKTLILIMFGIGALVGVWNAGGVIPSMILGGSVVARGKFYLAQCFTVSALFSLLVGTFIGTIGTIGVALMGIGRGFGVDPALIAGAVVSGAIIGDRMSPLSSAANLTAEVTRTKLRENIVYLIPTVLLSSLIGLLFFLYKGFGFAQTIGSSQVAVEAVELGIKYSLSEWAFLPPLLIIVLASTRRGILNSLAITLITSAYLAAVLQHLPGERLLQAAFYGVELTITSFGQTVVLNGGGMLAMLPLSILIMLVYILGALWEDSGIFARLTAALEARIKGDWQVSGSAMLFSALTGAVFCNQTLAIIIPGKALGDFYEKRGLSKKTLVLDIADSGAVLACIIPWHIMAMIAAEMLGVRVQDYLPYAVVPWTLPLVSLLFRRLILRKLHIASSTFHS